MGKQVGSDRTSHGFSNSHRRQSYCGAGVLRTIDPLCLIYPQVLKFVTSRGSCDPFLGVVALASACAQASNQEYRGLVSDDVSDWVVKLLLAKTQAKTRKIEVKVTTSIVTTTVLTMLLVSISTFNSVCTLESATSVILAASHLPSQCRLSTTNQIISTASARGSQAISARDFRSVSSSS